MLLRVLLVLALALLCLAQLRNEPKGCGTDVACHPWDTDQGPFCGRGNSMNLRFFIDVSEENYYLYNNTAGFPATLETVATYGFCPRVDELQAFNLTYAPRFMALTSDADGANLTTSPSALTKYVYAYGFGDLGNKSIPVNESYGKAMVIDNSTNTCPLSSSSFAIANFLILNVSLDNGKFRYFPDESKHPQGTGFVPTCDGDVCMYDADAKCIGPPGRRMCAKCYSDVDEVAELPLQIWVSYYGTDSRGRTLRSGANNPINFRVFSGSGVYKNMGDSFDRLKAGKTSQDDQLEP